MLTCADIEIINAMISHALNERSIPIGRDAIAADSSAYDPADGSHSMILGDTATMFGDDGNATVTLPKVPIAHSVYGDQYGPRGDERVTLLPTQHGFDALFTYGEDDSPGAPSGEIWRVHRDASGAIDHFSKWTNDGATKGDGLGAQVHSNFGYHEVSTKNGLATTHDDTAKQITHTAGTVKAIYDAQGQVMHLVAMNGVGVGDLFSNLDATRAAVANADLTTLTNTLKQVIGNVAQQMAQAAITAGITGASTWLSQIQAGLPSLSFVNIASSIPDISVPACSSTVRVKT